MFRIGNEKEAIIVHRDPQSFSIWRSLGKLSGYTLSPLHWGKRYVKKLFSRDKSSPSSQEFSAASSDLDSFYASKIYQRKEKLDESEARSRLKEIKKEMDLQYHFLGKIRSDEDNRESKVDHETVEKIKKTIMLLESEFNSLTKFLNSSEEFEYTPAPESIVNLQYIRLKALVNSSHQSAKFANKSEFSLFRKAIDKILDSQEDTQRLGINELGFIQNPASATLLKELLNLLDQSMQAEILNSLIHLADKEVMKLCLDFAKSENSDLRKVCARGLYKFGGDEGIPSLINFLKDPNVEVRNSATIFLGWLDAKKAAIPLLKSAQDADVEVRKNSILSLSMIRDRSTVLPVIRMIDDKNKTIRQKVIEAIPKITGRGIPAAYKEALTTKEERQNQMNCLKNWWIKTSVLLQTEE